MKRIHIVAYVCAGMVVLAVRAWGNIYLDEDFEGLQALVDRDWPVQGDAAISPTAASVAIKGANLRAYFTDNGFDFRSPKPVFHSTGILTRSRHFQGIQCLQVSSGGSVGVAPMLFAGREAGEYRVIQFAVSTDSATASLSSGTLIGYFRSDWSTTTTDTVQASLYLNFAVNGLGTIDIVCSNTATTVATLAPGPGNWALISIITQIRPGSTGTSRWYAHDPLTDTDKGPPQNTVLGGGMHLFVNGNAEALHVLEDQIGPGWGNDNVEDAMLNSVELGWEIRATNGGTLFLDDLYWDGAYHDVHIGIPAYPGFAEEQAARMKDFGQSTHEWNGTGRFFSPR